MSFIFFIVANENLGFFVFFLFFFPFIPRPHNKKPTWTVEMLFTMLPSH